MKPKSGGNKKSESVGTPRVTEVPEVLQAIKSHSEEFTEMLLSASLKSWSGHLRFNVKFERGKILTAQISTDNIQVVDYPVDGRKPKG